MPRVCVIGSANVDYTVALPRLPSPGETVSGGTLLVNLGGKGANQAVAARRLGGEVRMIGCVGDDADGRRIRGQVNTHLAIARAKIEDAESLEEALRFLNQRETFAALNAPTLLRALLDMPVKDNETAPHLKPAS